MGKQNSRVIKELMKRHKKEYLNKKVYSQDKKSGIIKKIEPHASDERLVAVIDFEDGRSRVYYIPEDLRDGKITFKRPKKYEEMNPYEKEVYHEEKFCNELVEEAEEESLKAESEIFGIQIDIQGRTKTERDYYDVKKLGEAVAYHSELLAKKLTPFFVSIQRKGEDKPTYFGNYEYEGKVLKWTDSKAKIIYEHSSNDDLLLERHHDIYFALYRGFTDTVNKISKEASLSKTKFDYSTSDDIFIKNVGLMRSMECHDIVSTMREEQYKIVSKDSKSNFVVCGCVGSGKTNVIFHRIAYLIDKNKLAKYGADYCVLSPTDLLNDNGKGLADFLNIDIKQSDINSFYKATLNDLLIKAEINTDFPVCLGTTTNNQFYDYKVMDKIAAKVSRTLEVKDSKYIEFQQKELTKEIKRKFKIDLSGVELIKFYKSRFLIAEHRRESIENSLRKINIPNLEFYLNQNILNDSQKEFYLFIKKCFSEYLDPTPIYDNSVRQVARMFNYVNRRRTFNSSVFRPAEFIKKGNELGIIVALFDTIESKKDEFIRLSSAILSILDCEDEKTIKRYPDIKRLQKDFRRFKPILKKLCVAHEPIPISSSVELIFKDIGNLHLYPAYKNASIKYPITIIYLYDYLSFQNEIDNFVMDIRTISYENARESAKNDSFMYSVINLETVKRYFHGPKILKISLKEFKNLYSEYGKTSHISSLVNKTLVGPKYLILFYDYCCFKRAEKYFSSLRNKLHHFYGYSEKDSRDKSLLDVIEYHLSGYFDLKSSKLEDVVFAYLSIVSRYYQPLENPLTIFVDEFQNLSELEIRVLTNLFKETRFEFYGDFMQKIESKGIDSVEQIKPGIEKIELNNNYRNCKQICEYLNRTFNLNMNPLGIDGTVKILAKMPSTIDKNISRSAIIVKSFDNIPNLKMANINVVGSNRSVSSTRVNLIEVKDVKGLEFDTAYVITDGMTEKENFLACSRALNNLIVIKN